MYSIKKEKRWVLVALFSITAIYLLISLYIVLRYNNYFLLGNLQKGNDDDVRYIRSALTLLKKGMLTYHNPDIPSSFIMPGLPFILALFIKLFGLWGGITAFRIFQCILQTISIFLIFYISKKFFGSTIAIIACVFDFLYITELSVPGLILTECIFKFLVLILVTISIQALEKKKSAYYAIGGFIWGLACLTRPTILLFPLIILIIWIKNNYSLKDIIKFTLITCAVFSAVMSPWWIRNYTAFHRFIPLSESSGNPLLQGTYIGYFPRLNDPEYKKAISFGNKAELKLGKRRLIEGFARKPVQYFLWYTIGKTAFYWGSPFYAKDIPGLPYIAVFIIHYIILIFGITGIILSLKKHSDCLFCFLIVLYFTAAHLPYLTGPRYSYPAMPYIIIFAAYSAFHFYEKKAHHSYLPA